MEKVLHLHKTVSEIKVCMEMTWHSVLFLPFIVTVSLCSRTCCSFFRGISGTSERNPVQPNHLQPGASEPRLCLRQSNRCVHCAAGWSLPVHIFRSALPREPQQPLVLHDQRAAENVMSRSGTQDSTKLMKQTQTHKHK